MSQIRTAVKGAEPTCITLILLLTICAPFHKAEAANILFYFGVSSYSHRISVWPLVTSLAENGHNVTFSTIYQPKPEHTHPKVKDFFPKEFENNIKEANVFNFPDLVSIRVKEGRMGTLEVAKSLPTIGLQVCDIFLSTNATRDWIQKSSFDLIIIDGLFNECAYGLAYIFNSKTILFGTSSVFSWWHDIFGFPVENSWISDMHLSFPYPMTFGERVTSAVLPLMQYYVRNWDYYPKLEALFKEKLNNPNFPSIADLERNTSLILLSSHYSEEFSRSLPPFVIPVGGIHFIETEKRDRVVPSDILKFMDESGSTGFIYISFGSASQISKAPKEIQDIFFTAIKNSKARFLWKWEAERPAKMPDNVLTAKWMPQQQVLGHPKLKAFMTHAGLMGLTEAITAGVPLIMFPIFAEQDYNSFRFEREGRGIRLELATLTLPKLETALKEVLTNPTYKLNMMKTMKLYKDRPLTPLQTAIWWTEYVLRNDDLLSLKPLGMNQTWFERRLLDVWALILGLILLILFVFLYILKKLFIALFFSQGPNQSAVKSNGFTNGKMKMS